MNENHPLHNRTLHISGTFKEIEKPDIETVKPDIDEIKADIEKIFRPKTTGHILKLIDAFPGQAIFGRSDAMKVLDIKPSRASELLKGMAEHGIIEPVSEHGKGKYRFRIDLCMGTADPMDLVFYLKDAESDKAQNKAPLASRRTFQ